MIKSILKPYYRKVIAKLRDGLHLDEHTRLLNHLIAQNNILKQDIETLQHELNMLNILVGSVEPASGNDAFTLTSEDTTRDLVNILAHHKQNEVEVVQLLQQIDNSFFKDKIICLIGTQNNMFRKEITRYNASQIISIELISLLAKEHNQKDNTWYSYPSHIGSVNIPDRIDILFVTHPAVSAYLLKRKLFGIGAKVTQKGLFILSGTESEHKRLATLITANGFSEVHALPNGKITTFDYLELREMPKNDTSGARNTMLYEADKMPSSNFTR